MDRLRDWLRVFLGYDILIRQRLDLLNKFDEIEHKQTQILELLIDLRTQAGLESDLGKPTVIETMTEFDPLGV